MKISPKGLEFIAKWEGEVLHTYLDIAGIPTIGVGHVLLTGESYPTGITKDQSRALLAKDVAKCEKALDDLVTVPISQNQIDSLCSFTFNCGVGALKGSTTLRLLNAGDTEGAANALLLWCKYTDPKDGTKKVNNGLLARRKAERLVFLTPDPTVAPAKTEPLLVILPEPQPAPPQPAQDSWLTKLVRFLSSLLRSK